MARSSRSGVLPSILFFFSYNAVRFGSPFESGYALATLPPFLEQQRELGLFSTRPHPDEPRLPVHPPAEAPITATFPFFQPDGLGMSIFITSPGLLYAVRAPTGARAGPGGSPAAAVAVLIPTLLYYGGGWLQYGYRYALDSIPFVIALCGVAAATRGTRIGIGLAASLIVFGVVVMFVGGLLGIWHLTAVVDRGTAAASSVPIVDPAAIFVLSGAAGLIVRGRLVAPARPRLRQHDPGGVGDPDRVLRRDGDRQRSSAAGSPTGSARPLRLYGVLELVLVVVVLLTPITFRLIHEVYRGIYPALEATPEALALVRFGLAVLALAPATVLMGATLPTLTAVPHAETRISRAAFGRCTRRTRSARSSGRSRPGSS